ncbi:MAG: hypothetical protein V1737_00295 [Chloroflexota bacterium]
MLGKRPDEKPRKGSPDLSDELGTLSDLMARFEGSGRSQSELLFKITTEMEDTTAALHQAEQLAERLRKHLKQLRDIYHTLTKK